MLERERDILYRKEKRNKVRYSQIDCREKDRERERERERKK